MRHKGINRVGRCRGMHAFDAAAFAIDIEGKRVGKRCPQRRDGRRRINRCGDQAHHRSRLRAGLQRHINAGRTGRPLAGARQKRAGESVTILQLDRQRIDHHAVKRRECDYAAGQIALQACAKKSQRKRCQIRAAQDRPFITHHPPRARALSFSNHRFLLVAAHGACFDAQHARTRNAAKQRRARADHRLPERQRIPAAFNRVCGFNHSNVPGLGAGKVNIGSGHGQVRQVQTLVRYERRSQCNDKRRL